MNFAIKRPKRVGEEDEDELMRFQEEFLKNKSNEQPAAKVVRLNPNNNPTSKNEDNKSSKKLDINLDEDQKALQTVLTEIVERQVGKELPDLVQTNMTQPLRVEKIDLKELKANLSSESRKNKSLFAQNLELKGKLKSHYPLDRVHQPLVSSKDERIKWMEENVLSSVKKQIITGDGLGNTRDIEQIHVENLEVLSRMTPEEILAEQKKLVQQLDPKLVAFIRKRNQTQQVENELKTGEKATKLIEPKIEKEEILDEFGLKPYKSWLQMEKIEFEKLEWMMKKPLKPQTSANESDSSSDYKAARFDFSGNLVRPDAQVSVREGLHHHGIDPDAPGYTLEELFMLARSKFSQQRVLALQTLANIVTKCHEGVFCDEIKSAEGSDEANNTTAPHDDPNNLLNQLVDGGLVFLLRWCLDDPTESIVVASLEALRSLLQPPTQEEALDRLLDRMPTPLVYSLHPFSAYYFDDSRQLLQLDAKMNVNEKRELAELRDDEYVRQDLVGGLMRMSIVDRFRYLIGPYQAQVSFKQLAHNMFLVLFRLVRHSAEFCAEFILKYATFVDILAAKFLPLFISASSDVDYVNVANMLKLIRLLCATGPNLARKLYTKYELKEKLIAYLAVDNDNIDRVHIESIRLIKTLIAYSTKESSFGIDCLVDSFELLLKRLGPQLNNSLENAQLNAISLVSLFHVYLRWGANPIEHSSSVFSLVYSFVVEQFKKASKSKQLSNVQLNLTSVCLSFMVDYLERLSMEERTTRLEALVAYVIEPFLSNNEGILTLEKLVLSNLSSIYSDTNREACRRVHPNNLTYLPTIQTTTSMDLDTTPIRFLTTYLRLVHLAVVRLKSRREMIHRLLRNAYLKSYFRAFIKHGAHSVASDLITNRDENLLVYNSVRVVFYLYNLEDENSNDEKEKRLFYILALTLISRLRHGDEYLLHDVIATCLFNMNFWSSYLSGDRADGSHPAAESLANRLSAIDLGVDLQTSRIDAKSVLNMESVHIYACLNQIKMAYLADDCLFKRSRGVVDHSRQIHLGASGDSSMTAPLKTLFVSVRNSMRTIVAPDWMYLPIVRAVEQTEAVKKSKDIKNNPSDWNWIVANCLKFIYLLEAYFSTDYLDVHVSPTHRFVRLLYVYLLDSTVFLDKQVQAEMYLIYFKFAKLSGDKSTQQPFLARLDFDRERVDSVLSFEDLYKAVLANYDAESFGDYVFSLYLVVPLQQIYSIKYRQILWSDYSHLFKFLKFDEPSTQMLLSLKRFVNPAERSLHMIRLYTQQLLDPTEFQHIVKSKLGYTIIVAHLNSFLFEHVNRTERRVEFEFKQLLVKRFAAYPSEKIRNDLFNYKCVDEATQAIVLYDELPVIRQNWLSQLNSN